MNSEDDDFLNQLEQSVTKLIDLQKQGIKAACFSDEELLKLKPVINESRFLDTHNAGVLGAVKQFLIGDEERKKLKYFLNKAANSFVEDIAIAEINSIISYKMTGFTAVIIGIVSQKNEIYMLAFDLANLKSFLK